jgi:hypothetical protein
MRGRMQVVEGGFGRPGIRASAHCAPGNDGIDDAGSACGAETCDCTPASAEGAQ